MNLNTFNDIKTLINKYTNDFNIKNNKDLNVEIIATIDEEYKEMLLSELDQILPLGLIFNHEYINGQVLITFKEVEKCI